MREAVIVASKMAVLATCALVAACGETVLSRDAGPAGGAPIDGGSVAGDGGEVFDAGPSADAGFADDAGDGGADGDDAGLADGGHQDAGGDIGGDAGALPACDVPPLVLEGPAVPPPGPREIVSGELYLVYSILLDGRARFETSNIFVVRGADLSGRKKAWIFSTGYGDGDYLAQFPNRAGQASERSGAEDAADVARVVSACMGLAPENTDLHIVVPHGHSDHINQEFVAALLGLGYAVPEILVHVRDLEAVLCTTCQAHADPPFTSDVRALMQPIGTARDDCDDELLRFDTHALGVWTVTSDHSPAHTPGVINLDSPVLGVRLTGSKIQDFCTAAPYDGTGDVQALRNSPEYELTRSGLRRVDQHGAIDPRHFIVP